MRRAKVAGVSEALGRFGLTGPNAEHVLDLLGLGALAVPVAHHLATAETPTDRALSGVELGGLGILAAHPITSLLGRH